MPAARKMIPLAAIKASEYVAPGDPEWDELSDPDQDRRLARLAQTVEDTRNIVVDRLLRARNEAARQALIREAEILGLPFAGLGDNEDGEGGEAA